jgi:hypothetical protein
MTDPFDMFPSGPVTFTHAVMVSGSTSAHPPTTKPRSVRGWEARANEG